jgi:hypothetical protein
MLPILAAAALLAAPLPPGNGLDRSVPLTVTTAEPGATFAARFRDHHGREHVAECVTPCSIQIPRGSPFLVAVDRDGVPYRAAPVRWTGKGALGMRLELEPASVLAAPR